MRQGFKDILFLALGLMILLAILGQKPPTAGTPQYRHGSSPCLVEEIPSTGRDELIRDMLKTQREEDALRDALRNAE